MKRLLAALAALCLLPAAAYSRALVVLPPAYYSALGTNYENGAKTQEQLFLSALYATNAQFDVVRGDQLVNGTATANPPLLVNQYLRAGQYWPLGMGVGTPSSYGVVIHLGVSASAGGSYQAYRPDSLTLVGNATNGNYWPTVPQVFIGNTLHSVNALVTSASCSTGVAAHIAYSGALDSTYNLYDLSNTSRTWKSYVGNVVKSPRIVRGWRPIVGGISTRPTSGPTDGLYDYPAWNNGAYPTDPDTVAAWIVYNYASGTSTPIRGTVLGATANAAPCIYTSICRQTVSENEVGLLLGVLQMADSLSGGALYDPATMKSLSVAAHIDDGWKRGQSNVGTSGGSGIALSDTLALKAAIAAMNALPGFKYGLGFECDSAWAYQNYDERWWSAATNARLTPHVHGGQASDAPTPPQNANSKFIIPINIWGLNTAARIRYAFGGPENVDSLLVYGLPDYTAAPTDTMVTYWLSKRAFEMCDSLSLKMWGSKRTDHLVMPPADDWTNQRITHWADSARVVNSVDSVLAAAALSGAIGVRSNQFSASSATIHTPVAGYGYYQNQQVWTIGPSGVPATFPTRVYGTPCYVIGVNGYPNTTYSSPNPVGSRRSWTSQVRGKPGFFQDVLLGAIGFPAAVQTFASGNGWATTTVKGIPTYGQNLTSGMVAIHVADLGSNGVENTMPGYYNFKYLANTMAYANARGRQPIISFVWPEDMRP